MQLRITDLVRSAQKFVTEHVDSVLEQRPASDKRVDETVETAHTAQESALPTNAVKATQVIEPSDDVDTSAPVEGVVADTPAPIVPSDTATPPQPSAPEPPVSEPPVSEPPIRVGRDPREATVKQRSDRLTRSEGPPKGSPGSQRSIEAAMLDVAHTVRTVRNCLRLAADAEAQGDRAREHKFRSSAGKLAVRIAVLEDELARAGVHTDDPRLALLYDAPALDHDRIDVALIDQSVAALATRADELLARLSI